MIETVLRGAMIIFGAAVISAIFWGSVHNLYHSTKWIRVTARTTLILFLAILLLVTSYGLGITIE